MFFFTTSICTADTVKRCIRKYAVN